MLDKHILKLNDSTLCQTEHILQFLTTLEHLEIIRDTIFNRINFGLSQRVAKLENLKSRINRASQIVSNYNNIHKAITIKSKKYYPADFIFQAPSQIDYNVPIKLIDNYEPINLKPKIGDYAGKMPNETIQDMKIMQETLNKIVHVNDLSTQLEAEMMNFGLREPIEITPKANYMTSHFGINDRKIFSPRPQLNKDSHRMNSSIFNLSESNKPKQKDKVKLQDAPVSIEQKEQLKYYSKKKLFTGKLEGNNIEVSLPMNINVLGNIADLDIENSGFHEDIGSINNNENNTLDIFEDSLIEGDGLNRTDILDFYEELPIELIQSRNAHMKTAKSINNVNANNTTKGGNGATYTNYANGEGENKGNTIAISTGSSGQSKIVCGNSSSIPVPPPMPVYAITVVKQLPKSNEDKPKTEERIKSVYEEIGDNPIARLKKIEIKPEDKNNENVAQDENNPHMKKKETGLMDLLKQQINLRYKNLKKHEEEDSSDDSQSDI